MDIQHRSLSPHRPREKRTNRLSTPLRRMTFLRRQASTRRSKAAERHCTPRHSHVRVRSPRTDLSHRQHRRCRLLLLRCAPALRCVLRPPPRPAPRTVPILPVRPPLPSRLSTGPQMLPSRSRLSARMASRKRERRRAQCSRPGPRRRCARCPPMPKPRRAPSRIAARALGAFRISRITSRMRIGSGMQ